MERAIVAWLWVHKSFSVLPETSLQCSILGWSGYKFYDYWCIISMQTETVEPPGQLYSHK